MWNWWQALEANRSISGVTQFRFIIWNTLGDNKHSLESWKFLNAHLALTFNFPGRYSAVIIIFCEVPNFLGARAVISLLLVPSIFIKYDRAVVLSTWKWAVFRENMLWKVNRVRFIALSSSRLVSNLDSWRVHWPPACFFYISITLISISSLESEKNKHMLSILSNLENYCSLLFSWVPYILDVLWWGGTGGVIEVSTS